MNGIESVIQSGQPPRGMPAVVPKPLQDLMGLVQYLTSKQQGNAPPQGSVAEGIAAAAAQEMSPPGMGGEEGMPGEEGMAEPDLQDVRDTALPAMRQEEIMDQQAMQNMANQIQQQNKPRGIVDLEPDIVPLRAGGILGDYDDDDELGFAPGGLTPEFGGFDVGASEDTEPRVEAFGPGGKRGRFTAEELRRMGYSEEDIKRRFAAMAPKAAAPAAAPTAPAKPPVPIYKVPGAAGAPTGARPSVPSLPAAEAPETNPYEKYVKELLDKKFEDKAPTAGGVAAERKAALAAAGITGPAGQSLESGIKQLQDLYDKQAMEHEEYKKGRARRELREFLLAGGRGGNAWQNLGNAGRGASAYEDRTRAQDEAYNKLQREQLELKIKMSSTVEGLRRAEANGDFDTYQKLMDKWTEQKNAFERNRANLAGQAFQVEEQAATRREATRARRDIANQQAQMRAALGAASGRGNAGVKPPTLRDAVLLDQTVNSKFFTGAVTPEMRSYLARSEDGKRVLNDISNGRVKYDAKTGWGAAEPAIARAAELYKRDMLASTGREGGVASLEQALRDLGGAQ